MKFNAGLRVLNHATSQTSHNNERVSVNPMQMDPLNPIARSLPRICFRMICKNISSRKNRTPKLQGNISHRLRSYLD
jgi:hypothetical protein